MTGWLGGLIRKYIYHRDISERRREVMERLQEGKRRESAALHRVADATGSEDVGRRARAAGRESERLRERIADDVAIDVFSGSSRRGPGGHPRDGGEGS